MRDTRRTLGVVLAVLVTLLLTFTAGAQPGSPVPVEDQPVGVLAEFQVESLPSAYVDTRVTPPVELPPAAEVWLLRLTLDPDGLLPMGLQIGPTVFVVESGTLTLETDAPVEVTGSGAEPVVDAAGMRLTVVESGQSAYVHEDTRLVVRNDGDAQVTVLALLAFSPYREVEEMEAAEAAGGPAQEPRGLARQQPLGVTQAAFPEGPGIITIERVSLDAGETGSVDVPDGAVVGGVEQGSATVSVDSGVCTVWPAMMTIPTEGEQATTPEQVQAPRREEVTAGQSADLGTNDAFGCPNGAFSWQAGDDGATIIRASVVPAGGGPATPVPATPVSMTVPTRFVATDA